MIQMAPGHVLRARRTYLLGLAISVGDLMRIIEGRDLRISVVLKSRRRPGARHFIFGHNLDPKNPFALANTSNNVGEMGGKDGPTTRDWR